MRAAIFVFAIVSAVFCATAQESERLYCGACGEKNNIVSTYCFNCGTKLLKGALVKRLQSRLSAADSLEQWITLKPGEIKLLVQGEVDQKVEQAFDRRMQIRKDRDKTETERFLDYAAPVAIGLGALYMLTVMSNVLGR